MSQWGKEKTRFQNKSHAVRAFKERVRSLRKFGLTPGQYEAIFQQQGGVCAVCETPPKIQRLHVDHDHKTGRVRGLVCHLCNYRLLVHRHTPELLRSAADYLEKELDWRTVESVALSAPPDGVYIVNGHRIAMRELRLKGLPPGGLETYLEEPGINAIRIFPFQRKTSGSQGVPRGTELIVMTAGAFKTLLEERP